MKKYFSIKIPEPCHEGWETMSPKEKGRFCSSCSKTVVDFSKMDTFEIQEYLIKNKDQRICGHIKQTQLDSINIRVPLSLIRQKHSLYKSFFLAILITMGTSIFSCSSKNGKPQKIDSIEVIDTTKNEVIDVLGIIAPPTIPKDSILKKKACKAPVISPQSLEVEGEMVLGDITVIKKDPNRILSYYEAVIAPEFKNTPQQFSIIEKKNYFSKQLTNFVQDNFNINTTANLELTGKQRIYTRFIINESGNIIDLKVRAPHQVFEKEAKRVINKLPQFTPAKNANKKAISVSYMLPIIFNIEE